jgi:hypothetical protein
MFKPRIRLTTSLAYGMPGMNVSEFVFKDSWNYESLNSISNSETN